jgi:hypothetical protein
MGRRLVMVHGDPARMAGFSRAVNGVIKIMVVAETDTTENVHNRLSG